MDEAGLDFWDFGVCRAWAAVCRPAACLERRICALTGKGCAFKGVPCMELAHLERHKRNGAKLGKADYLPCAWKFGRRERGDVYGNGGAKGTGTI